MKGLSGLAVVGILLAGAAWPREAGASCRPPCASSLCGTDDSSVLIGTLSDRIFRVEEVHGAHVGFSVGDEVEGVFSWDWIDHGAGAYVVAFVDVTGEVILQPAVPISASGDVACWERPLSMDEAIAISTSVSCAADAERAGFNRPCNDVITTTSMCTSAGGTSSWLSIALGIALLAHVSRRR